MSYTKTRGSVYICIRSRDLINTSSANTGNRGRFILFQPIEANDDERLAVSLTSAILPNSFYNLSSISKNNLITFIENGVQYNIQIPDGNYNITELMTKIKELMESANGGAVEYTFSYDEQTNRVRIISNSQFITTFKFTFANSPRRMLGFDSEDYNVNSFSPLISNRAVDVTDTQNSLYVRLPNLSNQKIIESSTGKYSNILATIPVLYSRNSFFTYNPSTPFEMELSQRSINSIDIAITFQDEAIDVDLGNADYEINLKIDFYSKPKEKFREIKLHKDMIKKFDIYQKVNHDKNMRMETLKNLKSLKKN